jgi:hypothetical protein
MGHGVCDSNWIKLYKLQHRNVTLKRTVITSYHFMIGGFKMFSQRYKFNYGRLIFKFLKIIFLGLKTQKLTTHKSQTPNIYPFSFNIHYTTHTKDASRHAPTRQQISLPQRGTWAQHLPANCNIQSTRIYQAYIATVCTQILLRCMRSQHLTIYICALYWVSTSECTTWLWPPEGRNM